MTTQSAISAQSFGTSTNKGNALFSINPLTIAGTTTAYVVNAQVTNGIAGGAPQQEVRVWYTTTMRTVTAANAPSQLGATARYVDVRLSNETAGVRIKDSSLEPATGTKFHCWVDAPTLNVAATLSVDLVEI